MTIQTAIGLLLDIAGVILVAIPDASFLSSQFESGLLAEARERMAIYDGVHQDDPGFQELVCILEDIEPVVEWGAENEDCGDEYVEITPDKQTGMQSSEAAEHDRFNWGDTYIEARYVESGSVSWDEIDYYDVDPVYQTIRKQVNPQETNFRYWGLAILVIGFLFQLTESLNLPISFGIILAFCVFGVAYYLR